MEETHGDAVGRWRQSYCTYMSGDKVNLLLSERFPTTRNRVEKHRNIIYGGSQGALNYYEVKATLARPAGH